MLIIAHMGVKRKTNISKHTHTFCKTTLGGVPSLKKDCYSGDIING